MDSYKKEQYSNMLINEKYVIDIYTIKLDSSISICDLCEIYELYLNKWHNEKNNIEDSDLDIYPYDYERIDNVTIITYNTNYIQYKIELTNNNNFSIQVKIYLINLFNNSTEGNVEYRSLLQLIKECKEAILLCNVYSTKEMIKERNEEYRYDRFVEFLENK
jgi:hypothetical protein